jgi:phasin
MDGRLHASLIQIVPPIEKHRDPPSRSMPVDTNAKSKSANPTKTQQIRENATQQFRENTEKGAQRTKEVFETISASTNEAAEVMKNCCSNALQGMQDYNSKVMEFSQANSKFYLEFVQKLAGVKSPSEFFEISAEHTRSQLERVAEQAKQLTELARKVTLASTAPLNTGLAKAYDHAA